jgi:hypothetical protein
MRGEEGERLAREAFALARDGKGRHAPGARVLLRACEDGVDVGLGGVRNPDLRPVQAKAVAVPLGPERERRRVRAGLRLAERERGHRLAGREPGDPRLPDAWLRALQDRIAAEPLERESRLGLRRAMGEPFAEQAELDGRALPHGRQHACQ